MIKDKDKDEFSYFIKNDMLYMSCKGESATVNIKQIKAIEVSLFRPFEYQLILDSDGREYTSISCRTLSKEQARQLFNQLRKTNSNITIDKNVEDIIDYKMKLKFDFSTEGSIRERDAMSALRNPSLDNFLGLIVVFILISSIMLPINLVPMYFKTNVMAKTILFCISSFSLGFALVNLVSALASVYLGHLVTKVSIVAGVVFFIIGIVY